MWPFKTIDKTTKEELKWVAVTEDEIKKELQANGITDTDLVERVIETTRYMGTIDHTLWGLEGWGGVKRIWNLAVMQEVVMRQILRKVSHLPNVQAQAQPPSKDMERKNDKR